MTKRTLEHQPQAQARFRFPGAHALHTGRRVIRSRRKRGRARLAA